MGGYCSLPKRMLGGLIDYAVVFALLFAVGGFMSVLGNASYQASSLVALKLIVFPLEVFVQVMAQPSEYGNSSSIWRLWAVFAALELSYFTISEHLFSCTIGRFVIKTKIISLKGRRLKLHEIFARNILKVLSRYLLCVPILISLPLWKSRAFYDWIFCAAVIKAKK
ncbi:MAG: RDD family protein [Clostridiales bacterium]|nr:RDD family protein [Clostridiales bacterium]